MVWGSDRPHPTEKADAKPDDETPFDLSADWAPDQAIVTVGILVDNPAALYRFDQPVHEMSCRSARFQPHMRVTAVTAQL